MPIVLLVLLLLAGCSSDPDPGADATLADATLADAMDAGSPDAVFREDARPIDADAEPREDASRDATISPDGAAADAAPDGGFADAAGDAGTMNVESLSDEFDNPATLPNWTRREVVEGTAAQYTTLDIDTTVSGHLVIVPDTSMWISEQVAPFIFKLASGDFVMRTRVTARSIQNPAMPPMARYNTGGIMARSSSSGPGNQNWISISSGFVDAVVGAVTIDNVNSQSQTVNIRGGTMTAELTICRIGDTFRVYHRDQGAMAWSITNTFVRTDLPPTLQLGPMATALEFPDVRLEFDWIRFAVPTTPADCTVDIPPR